MTLPVQQLEGKYKILGKIGKGGMGAIYRVWHRQLEVVRVIKVIKPSAEADEELRKRFLLEARADG